jgi:hypothetical protein
MLVAWQFAPALRRAVHEAHHLRRLGPPVVRSVAEASPGDLRRVCDIGAEEHDCPG